MKSRRIAVSRTSAIFGKRNKITKNSQNKIQNNETNGSSNNNKAQQRVQWNNEFCLKNSLAWKCVLNYTFRTKTQIAALRNECFKRFPCENVDVASIGKKGMREIESHSMYERNWQKELIHLFFRDELMFLFFWQHTKNQLFVYFNFQLSSFAMPSIQ